MTRDNRMQLRKIQCTCETAQKHGIGTGKQDATWKKINAKVQQRIHMGLAQENRMQLEKNDFSRFTQYCILAAICICFSPHL